MTSTSTSRRLQHTWNTAWATAPPPSCSTLRNLNGAVGWGETCVFAREDGEPLPFSINTACMPWVTSNVYPSPSAFYSPATACPQSWTAVATQTAESGEGSDDRWVDGEVGLQCCPAGFQSDGQGGCRPGDSGSWPVVQCGEADAEENSLKTYDADKWPVFARPSISALKLRYQTSDVGNSARPTASVPGETGSSDGKGAGGLSTGAIAAIATVIPLVLILAALAAFTLWRRRNKKHKATALLASRRNLEQEKSHRPSSSTDGTANHTYHSLPKGAPTVVSPRQLQQETPEWNIEMDATEAARQNAVGAVAPVAVGRSSEQRPREVAELGGLARVPRKAIAPVEIDGRAVLAEVGDAYIPYRPGAEGR
ncbi:transmembrane alpha-helix domain-containing [Pyrenophora seminiperda CCB06]|uniref:Transmembrane alpha-helix domain-containing n=1 Tax=Pyrenophora seminiperda CCB06 TaxID=1302712 RepID=A0A3M7LUR9_9PLEO|nr:transmembrane alpha-helix domain-containing [Pyrenophora seminiperda CCB06]